MREFCEILIKYTYKQKTLVEKEAATDIQNELDDVKDDGFHNNSEDDDVFENKSTSFTNVTGLDNNDDIDKENNNIKDDDRGESTAIDGNNVINNNKDGNEMRPRSKTLDDTICS